jgi:type I restriction enzyme R subunit
VLHELKNLLDEPGVYEWQEVENFVEQFFRNVDGEKLSPIIDVAAARFAGELDLGEKQKIDYKIKAKQFVKIYGQMAAILPYEMINWEKLFWFLKFLIPKLDVRTQEDEQISELLESVDLSTYGLERTKLNYTIDLDAAESELDPQNPNPRSVHESEDDQDPLDEIIRTFNEKWFQGWDETPENQRVKFIQLSEEIRKHPDFREKYADNVDEQNRNLALEKILQDVMAQKRRKELELYKLYATDDAFSKAFFSAMKQLVDQDKLIE